MCENKAIYCIGAALTIVGCLLFAVICSEYIPRYSYSRDFSKVTCSVESSTTVGNVCCIASVSSTEQCHEDYLYPCVLVLASISDSSDQAIFYDEVDSAIYGGMITDCSYFHCDSSSYKDRLEDVTAFINDHQPGSSHDCYFGEKGDAVRALKNTVTRDVLIPWLLISIALMLAGVITCVVMAIIDKMHEKRRVSSAVPPSAENLKQNHESDDDSDIETIEISTTITTASTKSSKGSARSSLPPGSPAKRNPSFVMHQ